MIVPPRHLGNFLSGMETCTFTPTLAAICSPLETSLVEWKLPFNRAVDAWHHALGNFLSGMETKSPPPPPPRARFLGNFLSGMETYYGCTARKRSSKALETSLVEWKPMNVDGESAASRALETSLVEWKPLRRT